MSPVGQVAARRDVMIASDTNDMLRRMPNATTERDLCRLILARETLERSYVRSLAPRCSWSRDDLVCRVEICFLI